MSKISVYFLINSINYIYLPVYSRIFTENMRPPPKNKKYIGSLLGYPVVFTKKGAQIRNLMENIYFLERLSNTQRS